MIKYTRIAIVDKDKCQPKSCNHLCYRLCPGVRMGDDTIIIDKTSNFPIINEELCTGCGICVNRCPRNAIQIINTGIKLAEPIHQYGENQFRLFSLPEINKNSITGIIGRNGAGKTTVMNILSGNLIPNLGDYSKKGDINKVIEYFRGKNIQKHFLSIKEKQISIAYKLQKIEDIPKFFKKNIKDLLSQINKNKDEVEEVIKKLELEKIINKTPNEVSGGELQRIAIAATFLKKANLYFFDEFTTFLDIKQRLKIAKILREKINENNAIMIIEHDLAILDYTSDYIQVMFGKKNAYGICSNKKTTKKGINEFLDGFLKEENVRIRDYKIEFASVRDKKGETGDIQIKYPDLEKKIGNFEVKIKGGEIKIGEVIGILGANAIGKTTFIKMLAGELNPDNTKIKNKLKVSYKPQYIKSYEKDILVEELFDKKEINKEIFNSELRKQLDLDKIMDQKITELSGGELQRVAIAECLSKDADIYLIDEPSAFLDMEQRIIIANAIKNIINKLGKSAFVVDHDILFIDYISNRIMLFEGIPSEKGYSDRIEDINIAFNKFLKEQNITFRLDQQTKRPRVNKFNSQRDKEQRKQNKYYLGI